MPGLSASGVAAVVEEDSLALRLPLRPLTEEMAPRSETPAPLPAQPVAMPLPETPSLESTVFALGVEEDETGAALPTPAAEPETEPAAALPPVYVVHTVRDGDTLEGVAAAYGVSSSSILWSNPALEDADALVPGQELRIPPADGIVYDVAPGDTLSDIAARFGVDVQSIIDFAGNRLAAADAIAEGQTIFVPGGRVPEPVVEPTPAPLPEPPTPVPVSATPTPAPISVPSSSGLGARAVEIARSRIGSPYAAGSAGPNAFDCSGLVYWVYRQLGVPIPRTSWEQYAWATPVPYSQMEPGDIVFFTNTWSGGVSHVGIYSGGGMVVMAVDDGDIVREVSLAESYWSAHFAGAGRVP